MRVLMLTSTLPRFAGDQQANFVGEQADAWAAARAQDEIVVLAPHHSGAARRERAGRVRIERFQYLWPPSAQRLVYPAILPNLRRNPLLWAQVPFFVAAQLAAARRVAGRFRPDCVYAHWTVPQGLVALGLKRSLGIPYVLQNHSSDLALVARVGGAGRRLAATILREAMCFFCVNSSQREFAFDLLKPGERAAFAERCHVLPMGMKVEAPRGPSSGASYDLATIARLSRKKGLHYLIAAAESLALRGIRPSIAIAGEGEDGDALRKMVSRADIHFLGFLSGAEKSHFMARAKRFVFPARASAGDVEGLPVAVLEALCLGKPLLASRDTNIELLPEWPQIRHEVVLVADPADLPMLERGIVELLTKDTASPSATPDILTRYRWDSLIEAYIQPIEEALGRGC
jgi:glycosyltransferase involved in cell wall biosynthesis